MNASRLLEHFDRISEAPDVIPKLRKFILDLAVRGKLVEQDAKGETASDLLRQVETEQLRLLNAGEIGKPRRLPPLDKSDVPFRAPVNWEWARIRQVTADRGQSVPRQRFTYIDVSSINKEAGRIEGPQVLDAAEAPSRARKLVQEGDVIYSCVRPYLLNIAVIDQDIRPAPIASTAFAVLNGFGLVLPQYLWIVLRSPMMVEQVEGKMRGQAYPAINDGDFGLLPIPIPPLAEQHRIVAKVGELMGLCDRLEIGKRYREQLRQQGAVASLNAIVTVSEPDGPSNGSTYLNHLDKFAANPGQVAALKNAVIELAIRGRLVGEDTSDQPASGLFRGLSAGIGRYRTNAKMVQSTPSPIGAEESPFALPNGWVWARMSSLFNAITDGDHLPPPRSEEGAAFLTIGNVSSGIIDFTGCRLVPAEYFSSIAPHRRPTTGDLLYTVVGATYGRPVVVNTTRDFCVQRHIAILKPAEGTNVNFIFLLLKSSTVYDQATRSLTGIAQPTIPIRALREFVVPVPPLDEQARIVSKVDELRRLCDGLESQLGFQRAVRGRLLDSVLREALAGGA